MQKENLYKIINEFNKYMGMNPTTKFSMVSNNNIYLSMQYTKETDVPVNEWNKNNGPLDTVIENGVMKNVVNKGMISVWIHRNEKTNEVEFTLWPNVNIYTNSYIMPDKQLAERFYKARLDMARSSVKLFVSSFDVYVSDKLIVQSITYLRKKIERVSIQIGKTKMDKEYGIETLKTLSIDLANALDSLEMLEEVTEKRNNQ